MAAVKLLTVVLLHFFFTFVSSLYFHMGDTERKCFMEKIPNETMLIGNYRTRLFDGQRDEYLPVSQNITLSVQFKDPNDKLVLSRSHGSEEASDSDLRNLEDTRFLEVTENTNMWSSGGRSPARSTSFSSSSGTPNPESLQAEEEQQQHHVQNQVIRRTFIDEHQDLCQVEGSEVPDVQVEEDLQRSGRQLREKESRSTEDFVSSLYFHIGETEKKCFIEEIPDETMIIEGRFTFTSHTPGEHQICLHSNSSKFALFAGGMLRVHLDIQVGEHANNYAEIAAKDKLTELQLRTLILVAIGIWQMRHLKSFFEAKKLLNPSVEFLKPSFCEDDVTCYWPTRDSILSKL
ncbi:hypothetical protein F7725_010608 [Dissostichus mawsoni]|uniref:GOLD domain-containing protein n=1 Tax=Dissostichus mawsoni TaxID=36200 RepID=A0A7J5XP83_DISMA|nr:hypothetical protein F7725_010608 [Dissostichus mawsoni]